MKVFKSKAQESLIYGVGEQPGCSCLAALTGGSAWPALCLRWAALHRGTGGRCISKHLSFQNAIVDEIREFQK